ncbi:bifunctional glycosyltransferase/CDP-glycerol:glycerophosphate glycerophosphotransferase [Rhizohabitans arisaemae]|uniref:bifunctional glycosyltransferase/CDP-glycerol:glycerophosphate glycerophosphotransferase n=1 Tax=Rhizohabitans arisaemae TaxID=2720610 RepID=UPI0024B142A0|nr:CDP-glycerol glycerophosphotransferase family protein [Rhizohabitans arisaemae]
MAIRPECSVVVIAYNDALRLPRAVHSVLDQTLRGLEVVVVDDGSTDETARVAAELTAADPRVRYLRRDGNSGGCGAPRNDGLDAARAPHVMFLDSDDRLPRHACKSLLLELERTGTDFVTGQLARVFERTGKTQRYFPHLYARRRVVAGIRDDPEMFLDGFSTNKLYRRDFLTGHGIRFREDILYEDHVFSTAAFCRARGFAVVPWTVYHWHRADEHGDHRTSISLGIEEIANVRNRVHAAGLSDEYLRRSGFADLVAERQYRFLRQDLRVYLAGAVPTADPAWLSEFAAALRPYLAEMEPGAAGRVDPTIRVCCQLLRDGRLDDLVVAARSLGPPHAPPRRVTRAGGRVYWGSPVPDEGTARANLDLTALHQAELPFGSSRLRHEASGLTRSGPALTLTLRTYDPYGVLDDVEFTAELHLRGKSRKIGINPVRQADGTLLSPIVIDFARLPREILGVRGGHDPVVAFTVAGRTTRDRVLIDPRTEPVTVRAPGQTVTAHPMGTAAFLRLTWERRGVRRCLPTVARAVRALIGRLGREDVKLTVYRALIAVLPPRRDLALFESTVGKGYTCNPRYLYEEIRRRRLPLRVVWSVAGPRAHFPADACLVRRMSWRYVWTMARAGYWVDSHNLPLRFPKPRRTRYLQTWHGQGIKTIGFDAPDLRSDFAAPRRLWRHGVGRWDALVSPSAEFERTFVPANGYTGRILRYGYPRNDVLVRHAEPRQRMRAARTRRELEIDGGRRVLLYAPTYRDTAKHSGRSVRADLALMAEELAGEWVLVLRTHPADRFTVPEHLRHFVRDASGHPEVNDLMLASDALLTDYSSLMCDYANTGRPMLFFVDDWEEYRRGERGVTHDLYEIAPGPPLTTTAELIEALRDLDRVTAAYAERYAAFTRVWCAEETGHAAERVVEEFFREVADR